MGGLDACNTKVCNKTDMLVYPSANIQPAGGSVNMLCGDSLTGMHASGPLAQNVAAVAGLYASASVCGNLRHE